MQRISDIMTRDVMSISPNESIRRAAQMMDELNVGAIPVCDGQKLVGMVTDRDITIRATSAGLGPDDTEVQQVMSHDVRYCFDDQEVEVVMDQMRDVQIRRLPVMDHATHNMVGIVSPGDQAFCRSGQDARRNFSAIRTGPAPAEFLMQPGYPSQAAPAG